MKFINEKGKKINLNNYTFLNNGKCANTYHNNTLVFKEYNKDTISEFKISKDVFDILKDIDNPNFIKLYDTYMLTTLFERILYSLNAICFSIDAYTAKLYQKENINPLYINKEYLLYNLSEIEKLLNLISSLGIKVDDIHTGNTVYTKDRIIIIDPDFFKLSHTSESRIKSWNKRNVLVLFQSMIEDSKELKCKDRKALLDWFDDNFSVSKVTEDINITYNIAKQLKYVKKPIDIIRK